MLDRPARCAMCAALALLCASSAPAQGPRNAKDPNAGKSGPRVPQTYSKERVEAAFKSADRAQKGWISLRDFMAVYRIDRREYQVIDKNSDGRVNLAEFDAYMHTLLDNGGVIEFVPAPAGGAAPASRPASGDSRPASQPAGAAGDGRPKFGDIPTGPTARPAKK